MSDDIDPTLVEHTEAEPFRTVDGEYTIEVSVNGQWPKGHPSEPDRPAYRLRIVHEQYGVLHEEPQCASNQAFCVDKAARFIQTRRDEERLKHRDTEDSET